jgi:uncharacterized protein (DUF433 family)
VSLTIETNPIPLRIDDDGVIRVGESRVTLDSVIDASLDGSSAEEIVEQYPTVSLPDVYTVIAYYLRHRSDVDSYLKRRRRDAEQIRRDYEAQFPRQPGLRDRLMVRRV